jgi:transcriptional regulator with XRE-family HTH domain
MATDHETNVVMDRVRARFEKCDLSLDELGMKMGYPKESARKSAWQFLNKTEDPRLSMLQRFATAVECSVKSLV